MASIFAFQQLNRLAGDLGCIEILHPTGFGMRSLTEDANL
jgi:hypothetical protein